MSVYDRAAAAAHRHPVPAAPAAVRSTRTGARASSARDGHPPLTHELTQVLRRQGGRGDRGAREGREENRTLEAERDQSEDTRRGRRPEGGSSRSRLAGGDLEADWAGLAILRRYLGGEGDWHIRDVPEWTRYMQRSALLRGQLLPRIAAFARTLAKSGQEAPVPVGLRFHAEVENGEGIIGYQYLHGTHAGKGDFTVDGTAEARHDYPRSYADREETVQPGTTVRMRLRYRWNDVIDPNPKYGTDRIKSIAAKIITLGEASSYDISISWEEECTVWLPDEGDMVVFGYPGS
ncbi:hypothetical protein ACGFSB_32845 [Streptomyces sp. NPDC048441]|uniref:hypothetical protein n=1 Tax=Streptomyces sp. NPDC048441 TaxID=3365552 RepID=UPI003714E0E8